MNLYEGMFLLDPADAANDWEGLKQHVCGLVQRLDGEIVHSERWPDRKLAYEIKGCRKGTYFLTYFTLDGSKVAELRRDAQLSDRILRSLILRKEGALGEVERFKEASTHSSTPALDDAARKRLSDAEDYDMPRRGGRRGGATESAAAAAIVSQEDVVAKGALGEPIDEVDAAEEPTDPTA